MGPKYETLTWSWHESGLILQSDESRNEGVLARKFEFVGAWSFHAALSGPPHVNGFHRPRSVHEEAGAYRQEHAGPQNAAGVDAVFQTAGYRVVYPPLAKIVWPVIHHPSVAKNMTIGAMSSILVS